MLILAAEARADYIDDVGPNPAPPFNSNTFIFPNWTMLPTSSFSLFECDDVTCAWCLASSITGITMLNYGTATGGPGKDITGMYFKLLCGTTNTAIFPMTYAGNWTVPTGTFPAWTWGGAIPWTADPGDAKNGCGGTPSLFIYTDIGSCPTEGNTVELGPGYNPIDFGGITDDCGSTAPFEQITDGNRKTIEYVTKVADRDTAAPGDTINYTIRVGKPGTSFTNLVVMDTQPAYTHLVPGSAVPPADPGWDPDPGPPLRLRWTLPGGVSLGGGTTEIRFQVTVDWGNIAFEPDSGVVAAPEGQMLLNNAQASWPGLLGCATGTSMTPPALTSISRFVFWMVGSNDILFAPRIGLPDDEMTYEIFIKNTSSTKTWWDVQVWDTVPALYDVWSPGYGLDDACSGWTMTPSGCAAGSPGVVLTGGANTLLTWRLDLPPGVTLTLRWNARVRPATTVGSTAINTVSLLEWGRSNPTGTGSSVTPSQFTHHAPVILRTTYLSYLAIAGGTNAWFGCCDDSPLFATQTYYLSFFPLNKMTSFSLYEQVHQGDAFVATGGVSPTIAVAAGGCVSPPPAWVPGCGPERAPAFYKPVAYAGCPVPTPLHDLFKLVSNSPLTWEMLTADADNGSEVVTYCPTTSLTYVGYGAYSYARTCLAGNIGFRDSFFLLNTSVSTPTNVHVFSWDAVTLTWQYQASARIDKESVWFYFVPAENSYKFISSDAPVIMLKGIPDMFSPEDRAFAPQRETGTLASATVPAHFYAFALNDTGNGGSMYVGNMGLVDATYSIWQYRANNTTLPIISPRHQTPYLVGSSGSWKMIRPADVAGAGQVNPLNPHAYQPGYDTGVFGVMTFYKVELASGGPIQIMAGYRMHSSYDSAVVLNASDGNPSGNEFWYHEADWENFAKGCSAPYWADMYFDTFIPKQGTVVKAFDGQGYSAVYTTTAQDECVSFTALTPPAAPGTRNFRFQSTGGIIAVGLTHSCLLQQKMYSGPFVSTGVHYDIIAPPIVFSGQSFWITVVVIEAAGGTKTDYCGTTSFTSTDPAAQLEAGPMDTYNFTWSSSTACSAPPDEDGIRVFVNVIFQKLGTQTLIASDIFDGSILGLTAITVVGVDVRLTKEPRLSVRASGDTLQFKVCWSNYSSSSAFTFVITDAVPLGTAFVPEAGTAALNCGNSSGLPLTVAYSTATTATAPPAASFVAGNPVAGTRWLRWTIPYAGVNMTGCGCYRVSVN